MATENVRMPREDFNKCIELLTPMLYHKIRFFFSGSNGLRNGEGVLVKLGESHFCIANGAGGVSGYNYYSIVSVMDLGPE